jgi:hypothetical protein
MRLHPNTAAKLSWLLVGIWIGDAEALLFTWWRGRSPTLPGIVIMLALDTATLIVWYYLTLWWKRWPDPKL